MSGLTMDNYERYISPREYEGVPFRSGVDLPIETAQGTIDQLIACAKESFSSSHLIRGGQVNQSDVALFVPFYEQALTISPEVFNRSTLQHLRLTGLYARLFGQYFNQVGFEPQLNLDELEALGLCHDGGRMVSHRRYINDYYCRLIWGQAGFQPGFLTRLPDDDRWLPVMNGDEIDHQQSLFRMHNVSDATVLYPERGIVDVSDNLAKTRDGNLWSWEYALWGAFQARQSPPDRYKMWVTEYLRQSNVYTHLRDGVAVNLKMQGAWIEVITGRLIPEFVNDLQQQVAFNHPELL